jgi:hypothetical protein
VLGIAISFLLSAGSVRAQSVDDKIKSLEQELSQLKEQQVELKKEATAAAAALPTFEYRPGNGLEVEARTSRGACVSPSRPISAMSSSTGAISRAGRRPRSWGGASGLTSSILQRGAVNFHAENLHPWLPTVQFGMEVQNAFGTSLSRQGQYTKQGEKNVATTVEYRPAKGE